MPNYSFNHVHHETTDVDSAVDFYKRVFGAASDEPYERGGATWVGVHIGNTKITVTDREFSEMELGRYQGYDHLALNTDDFDATLAQIERENVHIWLGPVGDSPGRIIFIDGPDHIKIEIMEQG